jgi:ferredoxin, 2Fe-2S
MGGVNPYIKKVVAEKPNKPFSITIFDEESSKTTKFVVDPAAIPYGRTGLEGSLMDLAYGAGIEIDHACGGVCACATCHVHVTKGLESCTSSTDDEEDMLDTARGITPESRLSCQCVPNGSCDVEITIPKWNKNLVKEGH